MLHTKKLGVLLRYCLIITLSGLLFSCNSTQKVNKASYIYFQNGLDSLKNIQTREPIIQNNDILSVQVISTSLNQEQTVPFNLPASTASPTLSGYPVIGGNIEMPVIGSIKAAGLTIVQLQKSILDKLAPYVKDPSVIIHFVQFKVNVLGEVSSPGTKKFESDRVTIIDAISASGDLTDKAKREDILVIREEVTGRKMYRLDIRSGGIFQSPAYLLQSNDIVYVGASDQKFRELKAATSDNTQKAVQIFATIIGLFTSIVFAVNVFK